MSPPEDDTHSAPNNKKRSYKSPVRKKQTSDTRELIISSGISLVREYPSWDWHNLTFKAIAERANISERTIYRHFASIQILKEEIIGRLVEESGVDFSSVTLEGFNATVHTLFNYLQLFSARTAKMENPSFVNVDKQSRVGLLNAVTKATEGWNEDQQKMAAAALDILWQPSTYERLQSGWSLDSKQSLSTLSWVISLIEAAIENNEQPDSD